MKLMSLILGILIYIHILLMAFFNKGQSLNISLIGKNGFSIHSEILFVVLTVYAAIATFLVCYSHIITLNKKLKKQLRNTEKASIETQRSSDKIRNLQAKIDTLEIALKEALKK